MANDSLVAIVSEVVKASGQWDANKHPRGNPKNRGEFAPKESGPAKNTAAYRKDNYFHGTRGEAFEKIKNQGLLPRNNKQAGATIGTYDPGAEQKKVYLGKSRGVAKQVGIINAVMHSKQPYVYLITVHIPPEQKEKLGIARDRIGFDSVTAKGAIPKESIETVKRFKIRDGVWKELKKEFAKNKGSDWRVVNYRLLNMMQQTVSGNTDSLFEDPDGERIKLKSLPDENTMQLSLTWEQFLDMFPDEKVGE